MFLVNKTTLEIQEVPAQKRGVFYVLCYDRLHKRDTPQEIFCDTYGEALAVVKTLKKTKNEKQKS